MLDGSMFLQNLYRFADAFTDVHQIQNELILNEKINVGSYGWMDVHPARTVTDLMCATRRTGGIRGVPQGLFRVRWRRYLCGFSFFVITSFTITL